MPEPISAIIEEESSLHSALNNLIIALGYLGAIFVVKLCSSRKPFGRIHFNIRRSHYAFTRDLRIYI